MNRAARRIVPSLWLAAALLLADQLLAQPPGMHGQRHPETSPILAYYDFEQPSPSGPDTFWIRQAGEGEVALSSAFRYRGERALRISEVPDNRDFAEFLAYFREIRDGAVFIQFYLLLTDPGQRFNFGLAGRKWFLSTDQHGHAIWLQTREGNLRHRTRQGWRRLFAPRPFIWHFIDIVYHVERGTYDLAVYEEGLEEPLVDLRGVSAMHGHESSSVRYFSLIGDLEDAGRFDFFVDELVLATDPAVLQRPFVAPGRRRFFVEMLRSAPVREINEAQRQELLRSARGWLDDLAGDGAEVDFAQLENAADVAFDSSELELAEEIYSKLHEVGFATVRLELKLSDIRHLQGDVEGERELRERIYGRLGDEGGH